LETKNLVSEPRSTATTSSAWGEEHFLNYGGDGRPYRQVWKQYNSVDDCVKIFSRVGLANIKSMIVLGTATGELLKFFDSAWGTRPHGCELSTWAYRQIPHPYRRRIKNQDLKDYVKQCRKKVDVIYANSFMYLNEEDILPALKDCARIGRYLFVDLSYSECYAENDSLRKVLKPHRWWREKFREAGFSPYKKYRRLWQSAVWSKPNQSIKLATLESAPNSPVLKEPALVSAA
jgi:hypothetical protein